MKKPPSPLTEPHPVSVRIVEKISGVAKADWDALANPPSQPYYPFASYDFLAALERSGSVTAQTGWAPYHLVIEQDGAIIGVMPQYLKGNSRGEFVFDHAWAEAYQRAGGRYFPKLLGAVPFTPAPGPRLLARTLVEQETLAKAAIELAAKIGVSSLHINFPAAEQLPALEQAGYLIRTGQQFRFSNQGYSDWDNYLSALTSRKRKTLRKERDAVAQAGVKVSWVTGSDITEEHLDQFWTFYQDTGARKWGTPYLTRAFFSDIAQTMADKLLFMFAHRNGLPIAGALNLIGGDTLYGRYWGCTEHIPFLHFDLCYYQAIEYALIHGLKYVDAGAQGEHKIARGYTPITTYSAHWIADQGFRAAIARYLKSERDEVKADIAYLTEFTPFKKDI